MSNLIKLIGLKNIFSEYGQFKNDRKSNCCPYSKILAVSILSVSYGVQAENIVYDDSYTTPLGTCLTGITNCLYSSTDVNSNTITIDYASNITLNEVLGGYDTSGLGSFGNTIILNQGKISQSINGAYSNLSQAHDNSVIINGGKVIGHTVGGLGTSAYKNTVEINNGSVGMVVGGDGQYSQAYSNVVTINGGVVQGSALYAISGGLSIGSSAQSYDNVININGGTIIGAVYAGSIDASANSYNNTVNINGSPDLSAASIFGGNNGVNGNTLNFTAKPITVQEIGHFEHYNFMLQPSLANDPSASLITAQDITLGSTTTPSTVKVYAIHSGNILYSGDKFILMQATGSLAGVGEGVLSTGVVQQGISLLYDVQTDVDIANSQVTATIIDCKTARGGSCSSSAPSGNGAAAYVNPQLKALSQGYLANSQLVMRGADIVADDVFGAINEQNHKNGWVPFIIASGQHNRYNSGSNITSNDFLMTGGLSYQQGRLTVAAILEGGWGSYDSDNSFNNASSVYGDGHNNYYGVGLFGRYHFDNGLYTEGSIRYGRTDVKFNTNDIMNLATGENASYELGANYISAHAGLGYIIPINDNNDLDLSAKYLYTTVQGKNVNVAGDPIHFGRVNSSRVKLNAGLNHFYSSTVTLHAGAGYEYEFDGRAKATTYGTYKIDEPSLKGGTGLLSLGIFAKPSENSRLSFSAKAQGYTGKREGVGVNFKFDYAF